MMNIYAYTALCTLLGIAIGWFFNDTAKAFDEGDDALSPLAWVVLGLVAIGLVTYLFVTFK